jgi:hypothetical protein
VKRFALVAMSLSVAAAFGGAVVAAALARQVREAIYSTAE